MACPFLKRSIMKLATLIARINSLRPSQYDESQLVDWINEVEAQVADDVINRAWANNVEFKPYDISVDGEKELLIPDENCDVYLHYLAAKIDFWNGELERYNNSASMYMSSWRSFAGSYRRNHMPKCLTPAGAELYWPDPLRSET